MFKKNSGLELNVSRSGGQPKPGIPLLHRGTDGGRWAWRWGGGGGGGGTANLWNSTKVTRHEHTEVYSRVRVSKETLLIFLFLFRLVPSTGQTDGRRADRPWISDTQNLVDLRICILEDSRIDVLSKKGESEKREMFGLQAHSGCCDAVKTLCTFLYCEPTVFVLLFF